MSQDEFTKLFKYVQEMRSEMHQGFEETATRKQVDNLSNTMDSFASQLLEQNQEHLMLAHKVDRMEQWLQKIASKTGVQLDY